MGSAGALEGRQFSGRMESLRALRGRAALQRRMRRSRNPGLSAPAWMNLLLQQTRMAGNTLPLALIKNPCIREPPHVVIRFALIRSRRVIDPRNDRRIAEEIDLQVLDVCLARFEPRIFNISQKLLLVADLAVPLGVHKSAGNQGVQRRRITVDLRLIPQPLENGELAFARIGLLCGDTNDTER